MPPKRSLKVKQELVDEQPSLQLASDPASVRILEGTEEPPITGQYSLIPEFQPETDKPNETTKADVVNPFVAGSPEDRLLHHILRSPFYQKDELEPTIGSDEASAILYGPKGCGILPTFHARRKSLYYFFMDYSSFKCLFCGSSKTSYQRAVTCIRAHLDHRPFQCRGREVGCLTCRPKPSIQLQ